MLAQNENLIEEAERLRAFFDVQSEWLLAGANNFGVQADEIEIAAQNNRLVLSCLTAAGWRTWRVLSWESEENGKISFTAAKKFDSEKVKIEFIPRVSAAELTADVREARLLRAREIAELARKEFSVRAKIARVGLSAPVRRGRGIGGFARILIANQKGKTIAVSGSVREKTNVGNLLAQAILWLTKFEERRTIAELWLVAEEKAAEDLARLHAILRGGWRDKIKIFEIFQTKVSGAVMSQTQNRKDFLQAVDPLSFSDLWLEKPKKLSRPALSDSSETVREIVELLPEAIDVARSGYGETLRFRGLPFLRVRKIFDEERAWFGVEGKRKRILDESSGRDFEKLLSDLTDFRRADAVDRKNFLYRAAPEAWLESILRRDVSALDPNLRLAPLHAQFRFSNKTGALDLLALRRDGRLVIIELKTSTDREIIFQAANYWRQIELQRRSGNLRKAGLFANLEIMDAPALVYLVAPLMSFHHEFEVLARAVSSEIEIWRFDLNEDWRFGVRVARRQKISG